MVSQPKQGATSDLRGIDKWSARSQPRVDFLFNSYRSTRVKDFLPSSAISTRVKELVFVLGVKREDTRR